MQLESTRSERRTGVARELTAYLPAAARFRDLSLWAPWEDDGSDRQAVIATKPTLG
jgi:hypothetical protein